MVAVVVVVLDAQLPQAGHAAVQQKPTTNSWRVPDASAAKDQGRRLFERKPAKNGRRKNILKQTK